MIRSDRGGNLLWFMVAISTFTVATVLSGCGGQDEASDSIVFSTPDALVEHITDLVTRDPYDLPGVMRLYFLEDDLQKRLFAIEEMSQPFLEFLQAVWQRYGEGLLDYEERPPLAPLSPAVIVERGERRAVARTSDEFGNILPIHLVEMGGEWYISGHTLIQVYGGSEHEAEAAADRRERYLSDALPATQEFWPRFRSGEFATIVELRTAMMMWEP